MHCHSQGKDKLEFVVSQKKLTLEVSFYL